MNGPAPPGGATVRAAVRRLALRASLPPALLHGDELAGLTAANLAGLLETRLADGALVAALGSVSPAAGASAVAGEAALGSVSAARAAAPLSTRPRAPGVPADALADVTLRLDRAARPARPRPGPSEAVTARVSNAPRGVAGPVERSPGSDRAARTSGASLAPAGMPPLSAPATLGAATPVPIAAAAHHGVTGAPPSRSVEGPASRRRPTSNAVVVRGAAKAPRREAPGRHPPPPPPPVHPEDREAPVAAAPPGVNGLAGLVSWWSTQTAQAAEHEAASAANLARSTPEDERPSVVWSLGDAGRRSPDAQAQVAASDGLSARQSLRSAFEDMLLAEARAAGIEVRP